MALLFGGAVEAQEGTAAVLFDQEHAAWTKLLEEFVHPGGLVDYAGLGEQRPRLDAYLRTLESVTAEQFRGWEPKQREAFWINAYNAYAIQLILDHEPVDSIKDLGGLFSSVFNKRYIPLQHLVAVDPKAEASRRKLLSLGEVEHDILFPVSRSPLFHFAIVCASTSCPELRPEAYTAERLDRQLEEQARAFLGDPMRNDTRIRDGRLRISKIFDWSEDELETYSGGIRRILEDFGPASLREDPGLAKVRIRYRSYDWSLNRWLPPKD